jgi:hypothetical protein
VLVSWGLSCVHFSSSVIARLPFISPTSTAKSSNAVKRTLGYLAVLYLFFPCLVHPELTLAYRCSPLGRCARA